MKEFKFLNENRDTTKTIEYNYSDLSIPSNAVNLTLFYHLWYSNGAVIYKMNMHY